MLILTSFQNACQVLLLLLFIGTGVFFRVQDLYNHSRVEYGSLTSAQGSSVSRWLDHLLAGMVHMCLYMHPLWIHMHSVCVSHLNWVYQSCNCIKRSSDCVRYMLQKGTSGLQTGNLILKLVESGSTGCSGICGTLNI